jgi:hypothetical protein
MLSEYKERERILFLSFLPFLLGKYFSTFRGKKKG